MEVHRQRCQACDSIDMRNIIVRTDDASTRIFVRCQKCARLVARYDLCGYYHHGKGIDSYLRAHQLEADDSGRHWLAQFREVQAESLAQYEAALEALAKENKGV